MPANPLDVLAQQIVAMVAVEDWSLDELSVVVRRAAPFAALGEATLARGARHAGRRYPSEEFAELRPRLVWDRMRDVLSGRPGCAAAGRDQRRDHPGPRDVRRLPCRGGDDQRRPGRRRARRACAAACGSASSTRRWSTSRGSATCSRSARAPGGSRTSRPTASWSARRPACPGRLPFWKGDAPGRPAELGRAIGAWLREVGRAADGARGTRRGRWPGRVGGRQPPRPTWPSSRPRPAELPDGHDARGRTVPRRARRLAGRPALAVRRPRARPVGDRHRRPAAGEATASTPP